MLPTPRSKAGPPNASLKSPRSPCPAASTHPVLRLLQSPRNSPRSTPKQCCAPCSKPLAQAAAPLGFFPHASALLDQSKQVLVRNRVEVTFQFRSASTTQSWPAWSSLALRLRASLAPLPRTEAVAGPGQFRFENRFQNVPQRAWQDASRPGRPCGGSGSPRRPVRVRGAARRPAGSVSPAARPAAPGRGRNCVREDRLSF